MSEEVLKITREDIAEAEKQLAIARDLIDRLKKAGEDTTELERNYNNAQTRLRRYKRAFEG